MAGAIKFLNQIRFFVILFFCTFRATRDLMLSAWKITRVQSVLLLLLLLVYRAPSICLNLLFDYPEAAGKTKFLDNPAKQRAKLCEGVDTRGLTHPSSLSLSSGPSSFFFRMAEGAGIVIQNSPFISERYRANFSSGSFAIASEQRCARCHFHSFDLSLLILFKNYFI